MKAMGTLKKLTACGLSLLLVLTCVLPYLPTAFAVDSTEGAENESAVSTETTTSLTPVTSVDNTAFIQNAYSLANGVTAYYVTGERDQFAVENQQMKLVYTVDESSKNQQIASITNKAGQVYLENSSDVYVKMGAAQTTYYAKDSTKAAKTNIHRFGYYYYQPIFEGQYFQGDMVATAEKKLTLSTANFTTNQASLSAPSSGTLRVTVANSTDPYITYRHEIGVSTADYNYVRLKIKTSATDTRTLQLFAVMGEHESASEAQSTRATVSPGETQTVYFPLAAMDDFTGNIKHLRLDFSGSIGTTFDIEEFALVKIVDGAPFRLELHRKFDVYTDKMHQTLQVASREESTDNIAEIGYITRFPVSDVTKFIIVKEDGTQLTSIASGDTVENIAYVGFDTKAGIIGFILPSDGENGKMRMSFDGTTYTVQQYDTPVAIDRTWDAENKVIVESDPIVGKINPSGTKKRPAQIDPDENARAIYSLYADPTDAKNKTVLCKGNENDFFLSHRIYTDTNHEFAAFLKEAEIERDPLTAENIIVDEANSTIPAGAVGFGGYDYRRGIYKMNIDGTSFSNAFYNHSNRHYNVKFTVKGKDDRDIYIMTATIERGCLENAALFNVNDMMIPVPIEVGKNFSEANGERNLWNVDDISYSEAIIPMKLTASTNETYNMMNLYQNWGQHRLKQISWIQFGSPYYHLSTGSTETNCIVPWSFATLPDHRPMSAPMWVGDPQHNSGGSHTWLMYTDKDGVYSDTESQRLTIDSFGPTYADVKMDFVSDDGKFAVSYIHTEFPQTDENRAYYEITYTVLEDISFADFKEDFQFYRVTDNDPYGVYQKVGYLNENNECTVMDAVSPVYTIENEGTETEKFVYPATQNVEPRGAVLGTQCPYFSFFYMKDARSSVNHSVGSDASGYTNLSFLIYNYDFSNTGKTGGTDLSNTNFYIKNYVEGNSSYVKLTLNEGAVDLKAGDSFTINAIAMPWGSQEDAAEYAQNLDNNVREVRENTLLNPLTVTPVANSCTNLNSTFVPKVKSVDGESATFTLTGGQNSVPVRIYGFRKLTVPKIEELVDGVWVDYEVCSAYALDQESNGHYYDGYCVYYDKDGTYSYSFVTDMDYTDVGGRTFRITAVEDFEGWPEELPENGYPNVYVDAAALAAKAGSAFGSATLSEDETYVRLTPKEGSPECYFTAYTGGEQPAGQYFIMKYRLSPTPAENSIGYFEVYTSTVNTSAVSGDSFTIATNKLDNTGAWAILVADLSSWTHTGYAPDGSGAYMTKYLRLDPFNGTSISQNVYFDISYIALSDSLEEVLTFCNEMATVSYYKPSDKSATATATKYAAITVTDVEAAIASNKTIDLTTKSEITMPRYSSVRVRKNGYALTLKSSNGTDTVKELDNGDGTFTVASYVPFAGESGQKVKLNVGVSGEIYMQLKYPKTALQYVAENPNAYLEVKTPTRYGEEQVEKYYGGDLKAKGGYYVINTKLAAAQQTDKVSFQIVDGASGARGVLRRYSVKDFADKALSMYSSDTKLVDAIEGMLNYGGYAQTMFDYKAGNLANKEIDSTLSVPDLSSVVNTPTNKVGEAITPVGFDVLLEGATALRVYVRYTGTANLDATIDGKTATVETCENIVIGGIEATHCVTVTDISADLYDQKYKIEITDGAGSTVTFEKSVLNYIAYYTDSEKATVTVLDVAKKDTACSMYQYYLAMKNFVDAQG